MADMPVDAHALELQCVELKGNLEEAQELSKHLTLYTRFLQSKLEAMSKEAMHEARPEVICAITQQTYAEWRASATSGPTPTQASSGNEMDSNASPPFANDRTRREARLLTIWGWDRNLH